MLLVAFQALARVIASVGIRDDKGPVVDGDGFVGLGKNPRIHLHRINQKAALPRCQIAHIEVEALSVFRKPGRFRCLRRLEISGAVLFLGAADVVSKAGLVIGQVGQQLLIIFKGAVHRTIQTVPDVYIFQGVIVPLVGMDPDRIPDGAAGDGLAIFIHIGDILRSHFGHGCLPLGGKGLRRGCAFIGLRIHLGQVGQGLLWMHTQIIGSQPDLIGQNFYLSRLHIPDGPGQGLIVGNLCRRPLGHIQQNVGIYVLASRGEDILYLNLRTAIGTGGDLQGIGNVIPLAAVRLGNVLLQRTHGFFQSYLTVLGDQVTVKVYLYGGVSHHNFRFAAVWNLAKIRLGLHIEAAGQGRVIAQAFPFGVKCQQHPAIFHCHGANSVIFIVLDGIGSLHIPEDIRQWGIDHLVIGIFQILDVHREAHRKPEGGVAGDCGFIACNFCPIALLGLIGKGGAGGLQGQRLSHCSGFLCALPFHHSQHLIGGHCLLLHHRGTAIRVGMLLQRAGQHLSFRLLEAFLPMDMGKNLLFAADQSARLVIAALCVGMEGCFPPSAGQHPLLLGGGAGQYPLPGPAILGVGMAGGFRKVASLPALLIAAFLMGVLRGFLPAADQLCHRWAADLVMGVGRCLLLGADQLPAHVLPAGILVVGVILQGIAAVGMDMLPNFRQGAHQLPGSIKAIAVMGMEYKVPAAADQSTVAVEAAGAMAVQGHPTGEGIHSFSGIAAFLMGVLCQGAFLFHGDGRQNQGIGGTKNHHRGKSHQDLMPPVAEAVFFY